MNYLDTTIFPYYPANVRTVKPIGNITLRHFLDAHKDPKENIKQLFNDIQAASKVGDMKLKTELKSKLFYFNPCVNTDGKGRSYDNITSFTGLMTFEFDKITFARKLKEDVFEKLKSCVCAYISPSGFGVKFICRIPIVKTIDEFKAYYYGLAYYFEHIIGFDPSNQNVILPLYLSWDPEILWRDDAEIWNIRGEKIYAFKEHEGDFEPQDCSWEDRKTVERIYRGCIRKIDDNAHPQNRNYAMMLGGYHSYGYIDYDSCIEMINEEVSKNQYMQKDVASYLRTALDFFNKGTKSPLQLDDR